MNETEILAFLSRFQYWLILANQIISLFLLLNLLVFAKFFGKKFFKFDVIKLQPVMQLFLAFHAIGLIFSIPANIQKIFVIFDPPTQLDIIFWIYAVGGCYAYLQPFLAIFITVERLLLLRFPFKFRGEFRQKYCILCIFLSPMFFLLILGFYTMELPLNIETAVIKCAPQICIGKKYNYIGHNCLKITFGLIHLLCSILFFLWMGAEMRKRINYRAVKFAIWCEIIFDIFPTFSNLAITNFTGKTISQYIGGWPATMATFDILLCAILYNWIFLSESVNRHNNNSIGSIHLASARNNLSHSHQNTQIHPQITPRTVQRQQQNPLRNSSIFIQSY